MKKIIPLTLLLFFGTSKTPVLLERVAGTIVSGPSTTSGVADFTPIATLSTGAATDNAASTPAGSSTSAGATTKDIWSSNTDGFTTTDAGSVQGGSTTASTTTTDTGSSIPPAGSQTQAGTTISDGQLILEAVPTIDYAFSTSTGTTGTTATDTVASASTATDTGASTSAESNVATTTLVDGVVNSGSDKESLLKVWKIEDRVHKLFQKKDKDDYVHHIQRWADQNGHNHQANHWQDKKGNLYKTHIWMDNNLNLHSNLQTVGKDGKVTREHLVKDKRGVISKIEKLRLHCQHQINRPEQRWSNLQKYDEKHVLLPVRPQLPLNHCH